MRKKEFSEKIMESYEKFVFALSDFNRIINSNFAKTNAILLSKSVKEPDFMQIIQVF